MARPKSFDERDVLERATALFWSQGYKATSISDLEQHLGIGRQSLYNTFGDKHALFLKSLEYYSGQRRRPHAVLSRSGAGLAEIQEFFDELVRFAAPDGRRAACFIVNTVAELGGDDEEASSICRKSREKTGELFGRALQNAADRGELPPPPDVAAAADFLTSQAYGILLLAKNGTSQDRLRAVARQALRALT